MSLKIAVLAVVAGLLAGGSLHAQAPRQVQVKVDIDQTHQLIEGFGACYMHWSEPAWMRDPAYYDMMVNDLGLSILRIPVPESLEVFNDDDDPDNYNWSAFILGEREALPTERTGEPRDWQMDRRMKVAQEFHKRGVTRFLGSLWSPPEHVKTHRSQIQGGHLRMDKTDEFAEYWSAFVKIAKKNYGIDIGAITVQNELLFIQFYDSCVYSPQQIREAVRAVGRRFDRDGIRTRIMMPEDMMYAGRMMEYILPTMNDPEARRYVGGFATHRQEGFAGVRNWREQTKQYNLQTWMTETSGHPGNWNGSLKMASDMYDYLVGGNVSAWVYWQLGDLASSTTPGPKYHAARHYYRFVRPGALRVESDSSDGDLLVSAFRHDVDGTLSIVLINRAQSPATLAFTLSGDGVPAAFQVIQSAERDFSADKGQVAGDVIRLEMPALSMVTLQGTSDQLKRKDSIDAWPAAVDVPDDGEHWGKYGFYDQGRGFGITREAEMNILESLNNRIRAGETDWQRHNGWTSLHIGILAGSSQSVARLIEAGANVNLAANDGWTPLHMAASAFKPDNGNKKLAPDAQSHAIMRRVLDAGADVHAVTKDGWTVLHAAVANAHTAWQGDPQEKFNRIRDLIAAGVKLDAADAHGRTATHFAAWQGYTNFMTITPEVIQILIDAKAAIDPRDKLGRTPLHYAAEMGHDPIVQALVKAGADINVKDSEGATPEQLAAARDLTRTVAILKGQQPDGAPAAQTPAPGPLGRELYLAARSGDGARVRQLIEQGADMNYMDSDGFRGVDRARDFGHAEVVRIWEAAARK